jgi:methionyl-tRNA formyltransferase
VRCIFAGTPDVGVPALEALLASRHEVIAVLTRPDAPRGRGRAIERGPIAMVADAHGITVLAPVNIRDPEFEATLRALEPDCCPVVAYGALIPPSLLVLPRHGWVNLHFSLLPAWRGAAPVQWAVLHGDDVTGATTFQIGEGLDDGPVFGTVTETITPVDTTGDLLGRLAVSGSALLVGTLDAIEEGTITPVPQLADGLTHAPKLSTQDARIRWTDPWVGVDRRIRATTPNPGAWTMAGDERVALGPLGTPRGELPVGLEPGAVLITKLDVWVGTGTTPARLGDIRPAGKRSMPAVDWARGLRTERLEFL